MASIISEASTKPGQAQTAFGRCNGLFDSYTPSTVHTAITNSGSF
jgi:hypothetical protein